jgi:hypothetical protein
MKITDSKDRPHKFYKANKDNYYCSTINDITKNESIWEIDISKGKMIPVSLNITALKNNQLDKLSDFKHISVNCE